jgi:hypothetical protein
LIRIECDVRDAAEADADLGEVLTSHISVLVLEDIEGRNGPEDTKTPKRKLGTMYKG